MSPRPISSSLRRRPALTRLQMDTAAMQQAAAMTNGKCTRFRMPLDCQADLPGGRQVPVENLPSVPALEPLAGALLVFLVLLISEWLLRKKGRNGIIESAGPAPTRRRLQTLATVLPTDVSPWSERDRGKRVGLGG